MKTSTRWWSVRHTACLALLGCLTVVAASSPGGAADDPDTSKKATDTKPSEPSKQNAPDAKPAADKDKKAPDAKPVADTDKKPSDVKLASDEGKDEGGKGAEDRDRLFKGYTRPGVPDDKIANGIIA